MRSRDDDRGSRGRDDRDSGRGGRGRGGDRPRFSYQARSADEVTKRAESGGNHYDVYLKDVVKMFKANDKDNTIRILPPTWDQPKHYGLDIWVHYGVGPDRQTYLCLHKMKGEPCPICEEQQQMQRAGEEDLAKELKATRRVLVYLIDRDHEKEGVQAWAMPQGLDADITKVSVDKRTQEVLPLDHPDEGYDVNFEKNGQQQRTKYEGVALARRESSLGDDTWLDFAVDHPLPDQLVYYPYAHIAAAFGGKSATGGASRDDRPSPDRERGRDSSRSRDSDEREDRGRGGREERSSRGREEPELTWESVHEMTGRELDALVESKQLDIKADDAEDDEELADWICEDLNLRKAAKHSSRGDSGGDSARDRMRRSRGD